ncbi:MAG: dTDP-4-dehydrorhamnose 3,5-epimerase [Polyangiales bacterium]
MKFTETPVEGAYVIEMKPIQDERGFFARTWCRTELEEQGLNAALEQINLGFSTKAHTLRGLHFQGAPHAEVKLVSCPRGSVFDVVADLRPESSTYLKWHGVELSLGNGRMLYVPEGCAHGYLTLEADTVLVYNTSKKYAPDVASGVAWNDPALGIVWPAQPAVISDADRGWPSLEHAK